MYVLFSVLCFIVFSVYCFCVNVYCTAATVCQTQLQLTNISDIKFRADLTVTSISFRTTELLHALIQDTTLQKNITVQNTVLELYDLFSNLKKKISIIM